LFNPILGILASSGAVAGGSYESIATTTLTGTQATITFTSGGAWNAYKHLQVRFIARTNRSSANSDVIAIKPNGSVSSDGHYLYGNGSSLSGGQATGFVGWGTGASAGSDTFAVGVIDILDFADTNKNKTIRSLAGYDNNGSGELALFSVLQTSTTALTSFDVYSINGASFIAGTSFALYGIKD
jgi:hypothetical protein